MKHKTISTKAALAAAVSAAGLALGVAPAQAGGDRDHYGSLKDAPVYAPPPLWIGFYAGIHGGYATGEWDGDLDTPPLSLPGEETFVIDRSASLDADGWLGGIQAGYNDQAGPYVIGFEGDFSWSGIDDSRTFTDTFDPFDFTSKLDIDLDYLATFRLRAGYAMDNVLFYATGGLALAETKARLDIHGTGGDGFDATTRVNGEGDHLGWTAGLGVEAMAFSHVSMKAEWLYVDLGEDNLRFDNDTFNEAAFNAARYDTDLSFNVFRVGLNIKYSDLRAPIDPLW